MADWLAAWRWWLALAAIGAVALPLTRTLLARLPDQGYSVARMLGLLLAAYLFWVLGALGFLGNSTGGVLLALALVAGASWWAERRLAEPTLTWLRRERRYVLTVELLFAALFAGWVAVRMHNPTIAATEKPMEIAFLNAIGRTPAFPPPDPWLSGFSISYYYFGYVMTALLGRLAGVAEAVGFNLAVAWLVAGSGIGALGLVYNVIALRGPGARRSGLVLGAISAVALPLAGNLQVLLELAHANGLGGAAFWAWLNIENIDGPAAAGGFGRTGPRFWWWWRSSRLIREQTLGGAPALEPIHEFPAFSFVLGDLHPHVLALPFAFLALTLALAWYMRPAARDRSVVADLASMPFVLTALVIGGLSFLNTWDVLIHLFIVVAAYGLAHYRASGRVDEALPGRVALFAGALLALGVVAYLPFYAGFSSQAGPPFILPTLVRPTRLPHFLVIFGLPLGVIVAGLVSEAAAARGRFGRIGLSAALGLPLLLGVVLFVMLAVIGVAADGPRRLAELGAQLGVTLPGSGAGSALLRLAPAIWLARLGTPGVRIVLALLVGVTVMLLAQHGARPAADGDAPSTPSPLPFVLLLVLTGALLTIGPEYVYLKDQFGQRMNTIFKFYYQTWVLWGVAAPALLHHLLQQRPAAGRLVAGAAGVVLVGVLAFPVYGVAARSAEYGGQPTLDGLAHLTAADREAIAWLRANSAADAVVLEATGDQYSAYGRMSAYSGVPTLLGWAGHEIQWRGSTPEPGERARVIDQIYSQTAWDGVPALLDRYDVRYIVVGDLERQRYPGGGLDKFDSRLATVFRNERVVIYAWEPTPAQFGR